VAVQNKSRTVRVIILRACSSPPRTTAGYSC
jgi:hypothetical protein